MFKFSIVTLGCKLNQYEEEMMREQMLNAGFTPGSVENADVVIFNSCGVTGESVRKLFQRIRHVKRLNPRSKVVVTGCAVQTDTDRFRIPEVDAVIGVHGKKRILPFVLNVLEEERYVFDVDRVYWKGERLEERINGDAWEKTRAFVKIEDGCDRACSYCAIRLARGSTIRSKPIPAVVEEVSDLVRKGFREIVLVGVNIGRYGKDIGGSLADLLRAVTGVEGAFRIRLSSLNPEDINDDILSLLGSPKLCPHLHISLQSGSNAVLSRMNRPYKIEDFIGLVGKLRDVDPLFSISTDIIVGFPGETDGEFMETVDLLERVDFSRVHIFRFSPREGTPAAKMDDQVEGGVKRERARVLKTVANRSIERYLRRHLGVKRTILVEEKLDGLMWGYDEYYVKCAVRSEHSGFVAGVARFLEKRGDGFYLGCGVLPERKVG